jgi:acylaminoacyl-peptidase
MNDRDSRWHDFYIVDIRTGERQLLYDNRDEITSLILDSRLNLRLATTTRNKGRGSAILKWNGIGFEEIISIEADDALCTDPSHVNRAGDAWFLRSTIGRDKAAIMRVDWTTGAETLVARHDKADITECITDPRTDEVTAVSAEYLSSEWIAVDPATGRDLAMLERELGGPIEIGSQSDDDTLWVVAASRPDRPLAWHLFDRRTDKIRYLFSARPKLEKVKLAPMHGVIIKSRDGLNLILSHIADDRNRLAPVRPLPMVLQVHGGPGSWEAGSTIPTSSGMRTEITRCCRSTIGPPVSARLLNAGDREWPEDARRSYRRRELGYRRRHADPKRIAICGAPTAASPPCRRHLHSRCFLLQRTNRRSYQPETMFANPPPYWASFYEEEVTASVIRAPKRAGPCSRRARRFIGRRHH